MKAIFCLFLAYSHHQKTETEDEMEKANAANTTDWDKFSADSFRQETNRELREKTKTAENNEGRKKSFLESLGLPN